MKTATDGYKESFTAGVKLNVKMCLITGSTKTVTSISTTTENTWKGTEMTKTLRTSKNGLKTIHPSLTGKNSRNGQKKCGIKKAMNGCMPSLRLGKLKKAEFRKSGSMKKA